VNACILGETHAKNVKHKYLANKELQEGDRTMKRTGGVILSSLLRAIGQHVISNWLLIIIFSCLAAYLIFPGPLDHTSFVLWPAEAGTVPARVSFTVSGTTTYPGIVSLNINITNVDIITHDYAILAAIGSYATQEWYGPGWYRDNLAPSTDVQNIPDPWYNQAFICTGTLNPGQSFQVTRKILIENNPRITDALVIVNNKYDAKKEFGRKMELNVINR
jgi:hypothetical protein